MRGGNFQKQFAGKVNKIAKMLVMVVALEGLQPVVTAFFKENIHIVKKT